MANKHLLRFLGNKLMVPSVNTLCKTLKIVEHNKPILMSEDNRSENFVFAFWHGTMLAPWYVLKNYRPTAIVSQSKDGELLAKLLRNWNYDLLRGSSSRDGKAVLDELVISASNNETIAITPDGPRGPKEEMKAGTIVISKKAQVPIVLIGVYYKKKIVLNSWDRFEIPFVFSRVSLVYSNPVLIEKGLSFDDTSKAIKKLEGELNNLQKKAEKLC